MLPLKTIRTLSILTIRHASGQEMRKEREGTGGGEKGERIAWVRKLDQQTQHNREGEKRDIFAYYRTNEENGQIKKKNSGQQRRFGRRRGKGGKRGGKGVRVCSQQALNLWLACQRGRGPKSAGVQSFSITNWECRLGGGWEGYGVNNHLGGRCNQRRVSCQECNEKKELRN